MQGKKRGGVARFSYDDYVLPKLFGVIKIVFSPLVS